MQAQFEVDEALWGKVRVAALQRKKTVGELVVPLIEAEFGESGKPVVGLGAHRMASQGGSTPPAGTKPVGEPSVRSYEVKKVEVPSGWSEPAVAKEKPRKAHPIGSVVEEDAVATRTCWKCKSKVTSWTVDKVGHAWCPGCVEDSRIAIP